jgi:hypothetical protein
MQMADAAHVMLSVINEEAAAENNKVDLFSDGERFPAVFDARQAVVEAEQRLVRSKGGIDPCAERTLHCKLDLGSC